MDKKGQGLSISTIILIILGVIVLVILVLGFSVGWKNIVPYVSQSNVNTISSQCSVACTTNSVYDFCSRTFDLSSGVTSLKNVTCNYLAQKQPSYSIDSCSSVSCSNIVLLDNPDSNNGNIQYTANNFNSQSVCPKYPSDTGKTLQTLISNVLYTINCP